MWKTLFSFPSKYQFQGISTQSPHWGLKVEQLSTVSRNLKQSKALGLFPFPLAAIFSDPLRKAAPRSYLSNAIFDSQKKKKSKIARLNLDLKRGKCWVECKRVCG